jgi:hypothetical protein
VLLLIGSLERNCRISVKNTRAWALKGRFNVATRVREQLPWVYDEREETPFVEILAVSFYVHFIFFVS